MMYGEVTDMNNEVFTLRRLLKEDMPLAQKAFSDFDFLHYNPARRQNMEHILLEGQLWGAFCGERLVGCTGLMPADSRFFRHSTACWEITDLLGVDMADCMTAGYVWQEKDCEKSGLYGAFCRLWLIQAERCAKSMVVHYSPRHIYTDMERLFCAGWRLKGLRGLDKLVPHYIFVKKTEFTIREIKIPRDRKICPLSDTKQLSALCEQGWAAVSLDKEQNLLFVKGDDYSD